MEITHSIEVIPKVDLVQEMNLVVLTLSLLLWCNQLEDFRGFFRGSDFDAHASLPFCHLEKLLLNENLEYKMIGEICGFCWYS